MASRTTALLIIAVVVVSALLPATVWAEEGDDNNDDSDDNNDNDDEDEDVEYIVVGGDKGWDLGVDYTEWASRTTFKVNAMLRFKYSTEMPYPHNVVQVDKPNFDACTASGNTITMASGDDKLQLYYPGQWFFISSLNSDCGSGMKLAINVA